MSQNDSLVDVLIVGAGPAGLMCAQCLAKFGVNVKVVDQRAKKVTAGQADGIQPRTLEVFQSYGLADRIFREGNQMHIAAFYHPSSSGGIERTSREPNVTAPTARYPFEVTLHQGAIEDIFLDEMRASCLEVDRPVVPISLEILDDPKELANPLSHPVKVVLKHLENDNTEVFRAKYVIGTDGAHSWVRKTIGIAMEGDHTDYIWGVVDTIPETNFPDIRNRSAVHSNNGSFMVIPREGDKVRLYLQLAETDVVTNNRVDKSKMSAQKLLSVAKTLFKPYDIDFPNGVEWWTIYTIGQRVATSFQRKERVFIAGDACHTHSPKAGQGMNAAMNDTHNLSWKITQVLRGWSAPSILSTYEFERRKYAQDLIAFDRKLSALFSGKPRTSEHRDGVTQEEFLESFYTFGGFSSGIEIRYAPSVITDVQFQALAKNLLIGQRMVPQVIRRAADGRPYQLQDLLPSDVRFKVLVFAGDFSKDTQLLMLRKLADDMERILNKYSRNEGIERVFEVLSISIPGDENIEYTVLPRILHLHWSKAFFDQKELQGPSGGTAYAIYGISAEGAVVVVRPDGYVGTVVPLDNAEHLDRYFAGFMNHASNNFSA